MKSTVNKMRTYWPKFPDGAKYEINEDTVLTWSIYTCIVEDLEDEIHHLKWNITDNYFENPEVLPDNADQIITLGRRIAQFYADYDIYLVDENNNVTKWKRK